MVQIREARYSDLPQIARVLTEAFWDDALFGETIHPHRKQYPRDCDLYWLRRAQVNWWDPTHRFLVSVTTDAAGNEIVTGSAQWARLGSGNALMKRYWFDPRNLIPHLASFTTCAAAFIYPNRAADQINEDIIERTYPFLTYVWSGNRAESWYLEFLGVGAGYQNQGRGRALVAWGMEKAEREGVCATVISTHGKERFYERCGFDTVVGNAGEGEGNPLAGWGKSAGTVLARDVKK